MREIKILLLISFSIYTLYARTSEEVLILQKEISSYREKSRKLDIEFVELETEMKKDEKSREILKQKQKMVITTLQDDINKLHNELNDFKTENRSLKKKLHNIRLNINYSRWREEELVKTLISELDKIERFLDQLPSELSERSSLALAFLKTELNNRTITASEGVGRLFAVLYNIESDSEGFDVRQGQSPLGTLSQSFYYLRLGLFYLAAVSDDGKSAFIWSSDRWEEISEAEYCSSLYNATQTALGNSTPEFSSLPFYIAPFSEGAGDD